MTAVKYSSVGAILALCNVWSWNSVSQHLRKICNFR